MAFTLRLPEDLDTTLTAYCDTRKLSKQRVIELALRNLLDVEGQHAPEAVVAQRQIEIREEPAVEPAPTPSPLAIAAAQVRADREQAKPVGEKRSQAYLDAVAGKVKIDKSKPLGRR